MSLVPLNARQTIKPSINSSDRAAGIANAVPSLSAIGAVFHQDQRTKNHPKDDDVRGDANPQHSIKVLRLRCELVKVPMRFKLAPQRLQ